MIRIVVNDNASAAKKYFDESLSHGDYYLETDESEGVWGGKGAAKLGLKGKIEKDSFHKLCDNLNPRTNKGLTPRTTKNRRVGYDFNFHAPKGLSLAFELNEDQEILDAFKSAVSETMDEMEEEMKTRVRIAGGNEDRLTENMLYGQFVHRTARPVGGIPDPHLHAHCFVFNATFDAVEDRFKAGQFGDIKRDAPYYEAAFHARLALRVKSLGYSIKKEGKFWDIAGISKDFKLKFSRRTSLIEKIAKEQKIVDPKVKDQLGEKSREKKQKEIPLSELKKKWRSWLTEDEKRNLTQLKEASVHHSNSDSFYGEAESMVYAIEHVFSSHSVVTDKKLREEALRVGVGNVTVLGVKRETGRNVLKVSQESGRLFVTHIDVIQEEEEIVKFVKSRQGCFKELNKAWVIQDDRILKSSDQSNALFHVLRSKDQVIGIRGKAGTGKTTVMQETIRAIRSEGYRVSVVAPTASAARGVLRDEGFSEADTLDALLVNQEHLLKLKNQVIWIDEAGLMSADQMKRVFQVAEETNARVILSGDTGQHRSVSRGDALSLLEKYADLKPVEISKIWRQKSEPYREIVQDISEKNLENAFKKLDQEKWIVTDFDKCRLIHTLASDYLKALEENKKVLVVSPTHQENREVTKALRSKLIEKTHISENDQTYTRLVNLRLTETQKGDIRNYAEGQSLRFTQNRSGIKKSDTWEVLKVDAEKRTLLIHRNQIRQTLPLLKTESFQVYQREEIALAKGDRIRITENRVLPTQMRLNNGDIKTITEIKSNGDLILDSKYAISKNFETFDYGYCVTSNASQGKTVDQVFVLNATSKEQLYVSVSRGREQVKLYTQDKQALKALCERSTERLLAHDLKSIKQIQKEVELER